MSNQKHGIVDSKLTSESNTEEQDKIGPLRKRPAAVCCDGYDGTTLLKSEGHPRGSQACQHASKHGETLDPADSVLKEGRSQLLSSQEGNDIQQSGLLINEEILEETEVNAKTISQLQKELSQSITSLEETKSKLGESQSECEALRIHLKDIVEDLKETQEHVFRLQPLQENITQSDAVAAYITICDSVKSWIGFRLDDALNTLNIDVEKLHMPSARKLTNLLTKSGLRGALYLETDEYNIIAIVMEFLRSEIFERELYGAVEDRDLAFVHLIQRNMATLNPRRDLASQRSWRSETLHALVHSPDFDSRQRKRIEMLSEELIQVLSVIDAAILDKECVTSLKRKIIEPAIHLARQLHLSHSLFRVQFSRYKPPSPEEKARVDHTLDQFDCVDVLANGKPVKLDARKQAAPRDSIQYMFDIFPGFYCQTFKEDVASEQKVLRKPQALVAVTKQGQDSYQGAAHYREAGTILGRICNKLHEEREISRSSR